MLGAILLTMLLAQNAPPAISLSPISDSLAPDLYGSQPQRYDSLAAGAQALPDSAGQLPVFLSPGIVVTATRTPLAQLAAPASFSVLTADSVNPAQGVIGALAGLPGSGVGLTGGSGSLATLSLRGSSSEQVLFLLNGLPLNSALTGGFDLNKVGDYIQRVEVIRGPASSLYGANALAGVVNLITDQPAGEKPYSKITYQYGKHKEQSLSAMFSRRMGPWLDLSLAADWKGTDGERINSDHDASSFLLGLKAKPGEDLRLGFDYQSHQSIGGSPGSLDCPTPQDRISDDQQTYSATMEYSDIVKLKIGQSLLNNFFYYGFNGTTVENYSEQSNADLQASFSFQQNLRSVFGAAYQRVNSESNNSGNHSLDQQSAFFNQEYRPLEPWLVVAGVRYDQNTSFGDQLSPSLSTSWQIARLLAAYANFGRAYRAPTINELYWSDPYAVGNSDLKPEQSESYEAGARISASWFSSSLALYRRDTRDMIKWYSDPSTRLWTNSNLDRVRADGAELALTVRPINRTSLEASFSRCRARVLSDGGHELGYTPLNTANLKFSLANLPLGPSLGLNWQFSAVYRDRQLVRPADQWGPGSELPSHMVCGQTLSFRISDARIFYRVDNLWNHEYQLRQGYPMPRRNQAFGISIELWD